MVVLVRAVHVLVSTVFAVRVAVMGMRVRVGVLVLVLVVRRAERGTVVRMGVLLVRMCMGAIAAVAAVAASVPMLSVPSFVRVPLPVPVSRRLERQQRRRLRREHGAWDHVWRRLGHHDVARIEIAGVRRGIVRRILLLLPSLLRRLLLLLLLLLLVRGVQREVRHVRVAMLLLLLL
jgi:hypothetical protein